MYGYTLNHALDVSPSCRDHQTLGFYMKTDFLLVKLSVTTSKFSTDIRIYSTLNEFKESKAAAGARGRGSSGGIPGF